MARRIRLACLLIFSLAGVVASAFSPFAGDPVDLAPQPHSSPAADRTGVTAKGATGTQGPKADAGSPPSGETKSAPDFPFNASSFPGFYDASREKGKTYNIPKILEDVPRMWASYGPTFKKVGAELGVDPYALAAYCVFESYNSRTGNYNPRMKDFAPKYNMYAAGIAATQAQYVKGTKVPGLQVRFPKDLLETAEVLRNNPEYGIRYLASQFKTAFGKTQDLAQAFPKVAYPAWKPGASMGAYGTQAQYVSRAYVFYQAFRRADGR